MNEKKKSGPPRWLFAVIAVGAFTAAGIFIGILSVQGAGTLRIVQCAGFGILGLIMIWMAMSK